MPAVGLVVVANGCGLWDGHIGKNLGRGEGWGSSGAVHQGLADRGDGMEGRLIVQGEWPWVPVWGSGPKHPPSYLVVNTCTPTHAC